MAKSTKKAVKKSPAKKTPPTVSKPVAAEVSKFISANPAGGTLKFCYIKGKGLGPWPECQV